MKTKAAWEPEYHRVFVDLCVEQKLLGNKPGTQHLLEPFQQRTGARFNKKQLKNHWDTMCKQWKIWRRLVQCSDMKWDPETSTFNASDEDWANYIMRNPDAGPYRLSPPLFLKKLEIIFEGSNVDGGSRDDDSGSSKWKRKRRSRHHEEEAETGDDDMQIASNFSTRNMQIASNFSTSQSKGYWSPATHELFVDLLVQETYKGNRPDTHYPKESWRMMLETINQNSGKSYTRAQMKNHWDCTRKAWKIWCQVIGNPNMKWDPNTRTFGATEEDWRILIRENPRAAQFRRKQVPCADKLAIIFEGVIEPGKADFRPYRKKMRDHSESPQLHDPTPLSTLYINEPVTGSEDGDDGDDDDNDDDHNGDDDAEPSHTPHRRRYNSVGFAESRLQDIEIETPICTRLEAERLCEGPLASAKQYQYTIGECIECLDAMEEVEQGSDLYLFALDLFLKKEYREIFLQLKKSSLRMSWVLRLQAGRPTLAA
ncbi:L10-interacting MYB domain-containing protein [Eutrema salsugineum]|uniref:L10-interacting MYB domain-containing protein n=1 Tax=Eutrema salsugineum TaxID=72664 RepID=UPI000CED7A45|nr:L10-interacting MYB domain-containing protein [Eutrema salsugineum]